MGNKVNFFIYLLLLPIISLLIATGCQKADEEPSLNVSITDGTALDFGNLSSSKSFSFTTNKSWTITKESSANWVTLSKLSGEKGTISIEVQCQANTDQKERKCSFTLRAGDLSKTFYILQAPADVFELSTTTFVNVDAAGSKISFSVKSNLGYTVSYSNGCDWITRTKSSEVKIETLEFAVGANPKTESRSAQIIICSTNSTCYNVTVQQNAAVDVFTISQNLFNVEAEGGTVSISVTANSSYSITSKPSWVSEVLSSSTKAATSKTHTFTVAENVANQSRSGKIVFTNVLNKTVTATIDQKATGEDDLSWINKQFQHKSLAMDFTATWCGYCPQMAESFKIAKSKIPDKIEFLNLHPSSSDLAFTGTTTLVSQFNISGYPTAIVDYRQKVPNYSNNSYTAGLITDAVAVTEGNYPTQTGIAYTSSIANNFLSINLKLYIKKAELYKLLVLLLEDKIIAAQANGGDKYEHNNIARLSITNSMRGDEITPTADNSIWKKKFTATIPTSCNKDNLRILVIVLRAYGSQKKISSSDYGDYYVDNCASGVAGGVLDLAIKSTNGGSTEDITTGSDI